MNKKLLLVFSVLLFLSILAGWKYFYPSLRQDVPVTYKLGWQESQPGLAIEEVQAKVINGEVRGLLSGSPIVEYRIRGQIESKKFHPEIDRVQISERWLSVPGFDTEGRWDNKLAEAEILIIPIVKMNTKTVNEPTLVPFDITIQDYISTTTYGNNRYTVKVGDKEAQFQIHQSK